MAETFFEQPILNSPYEVPTRHHHLDEDGQPTDRPPVHGRRRSALITPVPKPRKRKRRAEKQQELIFADAEGLTDAGQEYNPTPIIKRDPGLCRAMATSSGPKRLAGNSGNREVTPTLAAPSLRSDPPFLLPARGSRDDHLADRGRSLASGPRNFGRTSWALTSRPIRSSCGSP